MHQAREDLRRGGTAAVQNRRVGRGEVGEHQLSHPVLRRDPSGALVLQRGGAVLQLGLRSFTGSEGNDWGPMMATACL